MVLTWDFELKWAPSQCLGFDSPQCQLKCAPSQSLGSIHFDANLDGLILFLKKKVYFAILIARIF